MTLDDHKGRLIARRANLQRQLVEGRKLVAMLESDLSYARQEANVTLGALQATEAAISDLGAAGGTPVDGGRGDAGNPPA